MKKLLPLFILPLLLLGCSGLKKGTSSKVIDPATLAKEITAADLKTHLTILASDEFEGRETGTEGNKKAANYIAGVFEKNGLPKIGADDSYFQPVQFNWTNWEDIEIFVENKRFKHLWNFISFSERNVDMPELKASEITFLGYGIDDPKYNDYQGVDVKGKVVLVYKGEPMNEAGKSYLSGTTEASAWSTDWTKKLMAAKKHGVKAILIVENEIQKMLAENRRFLIGPTLTMGDKKATDTYVNNCYISTDIAKEIIGDRLPEIIAAREQIKKTGKAKAITIQQDFTLIQKKKERSLIGENVLGYIEGSDPVLKKEIVVVTAHYDHLGKRGDGIYNGADDNGSGTSTLLEVAQALAKAKSQGIGPKRSVLVMLVTGEEKGLLGSQYYTEHPIFPLENTIVDINVDMVGRVDEKYQDNPNYIYVIGSDRLSTELHTINEAMNEKYTNLTLDYTYNAESDPNRYYYRSDHYNFAEKGIPAIFYFNGTHKDYHRTSDTVDKINFEKMEIIAKLVFHTTWELANRKKRIVVDVTPDS
ncbi:MAG: M28 family peptidase [Saprospiraceae bacterium]